MRCDMCGAEAADGAVFCDRCGAALGAADGSGRGSFEPGEAGDRRVVTALFADLVGYVRMVAEDDPEVVRQRVRAALAAMAAVIERLDGTREKFIGDAVFAVFGWPRAHDDDAIRAAMAGLGIRAALRNLAGGAEALEVRVGIATGEVVTTVRPRSSSDDLALTGGAITTAARIQSLARPGEILLDGSTVAAARGRLVVADRGTVVLRGQSAPITIHALEGDLALGGYGQPRPAAPGRLVGRTGELDRVRALVARASASGQGGVVLVVGEAGMGKTRLLSELEPSTRERGLAWTWLENTSFGQAEPYRFARLFSQTIADEHGVDSGGFLRQLVFTSEVEPDDLRRYGGAIAAIARDASFSGWEEEAPHTPADPAALASDLLEVACRYVDRIIERAGPRVIVIDDVHWMDPSSEGLVEVLVDRAARSPLVVLVTMRPGAAPVWEGRPGVERIHLSGLAMPETAQLATEIARAAFGADDARRIHERTAGNPLFVTETVRALLDDGTLAWHDGRVTLADGPVGAVPLTLRTVLGARIDALPSGARDAIGVASVIGMRFGHDQLEDLMEAPLVPGTLERLDEAGLIERLDDGDWRFSHALIHDAAYAGVLASTRRTLHARLADQLEASGDPLVGSLVAVHRAASGEAPATAADYRSRVEAVTEDTRES